MTDDGVLDRYGWRLWLIAPKQRLLMPPMALHTLPTEGDLRTALPQSATINASCAHGNVPPSPWCPCGVHYVHDTAAFFDTAQTLWNREYEVQLDRRIVAVSFGVASGGPVLLDHRQVESWQGVRPYRAARFTILGLMVQGSTYFRDLALTYRVPVSTKGLTAAQGRRLEARLRQQRVE